MFRLVVLVVFLSLAGVAAWLFASAHASSDSEAHSNVTTASTQADEELPSSINNEQITPPRWVLAPPEIATGTEARQRLNPCLVADPGFGTYRAWDDSLPEGQMLLPQAPAMDADGHLRVVFHFHGHEAVRKEWVRVTDDVVLVAVDLGNSSSPYAEAFADASRFSALLQNVQQGLEKRLGHPVTIERFVLSAWSAGYAAVRSILNSEHEHNVEGIILLDGLHASTLESVTGRTELAPFVAFARRAAQDQSFMFVSHSSIDPPEYVSTTQATNYLIWSLGGEPANVEDTGFRVGLQPYRRFDRLGFHAMGFRGATKEDHCAQVGLYGYVLEKYLWPRWGLTH
jgi:hypothetical protein